MHNCSYYPSITSGIICKLFNYSTIHYINLASLWYLYTFASVQHALVAGHRLGILCGGITSTVIYLVEKCRIFIEVIVYGKL